MFAEGPRQVINALTLYSVMQANLVPVGEHAPRKGDSPAAQFFINVRILANHNKEQAAILFGMLFTLVIWAFAALSLILAASCYILFLWHYIPSADDGLSGYCRRKVDSRLHKIVGVKVKRALAIEFSPRSGSDSKTVRDKATATPGRVTRQPTLPTIDFDAEDKPKKPPISRGTTESTLPLGTANVTVENHGPSKNGIGGEFIIPYMPPFQNRPVPFSRTTTNSSAKSNATYAANTPLLQAAGEMGHRPSTESHSAAAASSFNRRQPLSSERNFTNGSNGMQRSLDTDNRQPPFQVRDTPGSAAIRNPGLQSPWQSESNFTNKQSQSTTKDDRFGAVAEVSPLDRSGGRAARPQKDPRTDAQKYEMQHPKPTDEMDQPRSNNGPYVAFNPHVLTQPEIPLPESVLTKPPMGSTRNFTLPFNRFPPGNNNPIKQQTTTPRSITTPTSKPFNPSRPPEISRNATSHPHSESLPLITTAPSRAATAGSGGAATIWNAAAAARPPPRRFY